MEAAGAGLPGQPCIVCAAPGSHQCSGCRIVFYCGQACQSSHWKAHKKACRLARSAAGRAEYEAGVRCNARLDFAGARRHYAAAGELGSGPGKSALGRFAILEGRYDEGRPLLIESLADKDESTPGHPYEAHFVLGLLASRGAGVLLNPAEAIAHFRAAAKAPGGERLAKLSLLSMPDYMIGAAAENQRQLDSRYQNFLAAMQRARAAGAEVSPALSPPPLAPPHARLFLPQPDTLGAEEALLLHYGLLLGSPLSAAERARKQPSDRKKRVNLMRRPGGFSAVPGSFGAQGEPRFRICDHCDVAIPEADAWLCGLCGDTYCSHACQSKGGCWCWAMRSAR